MRSNNKNIFNTTVLLIPWLLTFAIFWLYPLCYAAYISLTKYATITADATFIGLDNYAQVFTDPLFWKALGNTAVFTFGTVPVTTGLALALAAVVNSRFIKNKEFFRSAFFMPSVTSLVVISLIFTNLYAKKGYVNTILQILGLPFPSMGWLQEPSTALIAIMAMDVWISTGYYIILFLAGMQTIPNDLYDAAHLQGASPWLQFKKITIPMLRSTMLFVVVINTIKSFQIFVEIFVMTKGGPMGETTSLVYLVFANAFEKADSMGYASALAFVVFFVLLAFSLIQMKLLKEKK